MNTTTKLTKEILAAQLVGADYPFSLTKALAAQAAEAGLVVVYGASDDLIEFEGAFQGEGDCYEGGSFKIDAAGLLPDFDQLDGEEEHADYARRKPDAHDIHAVFTPDNEYTWRYETKIPHATFEITEDGEPYCRGLVIDIADLKPAEGGGE